MEKNGGSPFFTYFLIDHLKGCEAKNRLVVCIIVEKYNGINNRKVLLLYMLFFNLKAYIDLLTVL